MYQECQDESVIVDTGLLDDAEGLAEAKMEELEEEEEDLFQCGKCKSQFSSLDSFVNHKRQKCSALSLGVAAKLEPPTILSSVSANIAAECQPVSTATPNLTTTIVLSETEYLSLPTLDSLAVTVPIQTLHTLGGTTSYLRSSLLPCVSLTQQQPVDDIGSSTTVTYSLVAEIPNVDTVNCATTAISETLAVEDLCTTGEIVEEQAMVGSTSAKVKIRRARLPNNTKNSDQKASLKCMFCPKIFAKNFDLQQHLRSHTGEKPFQCIVCGRAFAQKSNVKKHMATHKVWPNGLSATLPKIPITVTVGSSKTPIPLVTSLSKRPARPLPKKANNAVVEQVLGPSATSDSVTTKDMSGELVLGVSPEDGESLKIQIDKSYLCQYCSATFTSFCKLKTHLKDHKNQQVYRCVMPNCGKTFAELDDFLIHTSSHENEMNYRCHVCSKQFATLYDLGVHQYTHTLHPNQVAKTVPRFYRCTKCRSKYSTPEALEHHLATSSHNFACQHCDKVFPCERYLRRHLPSHGSLSTHICPVCHKTFKSENYVRMHLLIHSGDKPFACTECAARFNRKDKLKRHSLIHQTIKRFKCPFRSYLGCKKEFHRPDKLKAHILSHSGVRPFRCHKCTRTFSRRGNLNEHLQMHTDDDQFKFHCQKCYLGFTDAESLKDHGATCRESPPPPVLSKTPRMVGRRGQRGGRARTSTLQNKVIKRDPPSMVKTTTTSTRLGSSPATATIVDSVTIAGVSQRRSTRPRKLKEMPDYEQPPTAGRSRVAPPAAEDVKDCEPLDCDRIINAEECGTFVECGISSNTVCDVAGDYSETGLTVSLRTDDASALPDHIPEV